MVDEQPNPVDDPVAQLTAIAWYDSHTMRALLVAAVGLIGSVLSAFGIDQALFSAKVIPIIDSVCTLLTLGGVVWAGIARARKPTPPIKLTQAGADTANMSNPIITTPKASP